MKLLFKILTFIATTSAVLALVVKVPFMRWKKMFRHPFPEKKYRIFKNLRFPSICLFPKKKEFQLFHHRLPFGFLFK
ncbi:MAG: hypothetical protein JW915_17110 [Chitinispirillaceae bacterium]|nr:hypothetical protein [Chitinispirillaceae bacterium]